MPYLCTLADGRLAIIRVTDANNALAKTLFELSRDGTDMTTHFDPDVHTLTSIAAGLPGHTPLTHRECAENDLPNEQADRGAKNTFRDAWEDTGSAVDTNMPKARVLHMGHIRKVRNAELQNLDITYMRAIEAGDTSEQQRVATLKQTLRDIPATFDVASPATPQALKEAWPSELPDPS